MSRYVTEFLKINGALPETASVFPMIAHITGYARAHTRDGNSASFTAIVRLLQANVRNSPVLGFTYEEYIINVLKVTPVDCFGNVCIQSATGGTDQISAGCSLY